MKPFVLEQASSVTDAVSQVGEAATRSQTTVYCAGGTTMIDLMKLGIAEPNTVIDLLALKPELDQIRMTDAGLEIDALATMAEVAAHPLINTHFQAVADSLNLAASAQIRNAATVGGNLLQRTRCAYFRDGHESCNKRKPGSGCAAQQGDSRGLAILGTSKACIANYPGDFAVALVSLDASVKLQHPNGTTRQLNVSNLHRLPEDQPDQETNLAPGELITSILIPDMPWQASRYVKVRDRTSYAFALASVAVALNLDARGHIQDVRLALGGLASKPWHCHNAEEYLKGKALNDVNVLEAAQLCFHGAKVDEHRAFKLELGQRTVIRGLVEAYRHAQAA
ncbi:MAG: xanthine dehydrogenase family protein subunit M [Deinococcota bacterium]